MSVTFADYIRLRLKQFNCTHVFGVASTTCFGFIRTVVDDDEMEYVGAVNELEAGYLADGYGRQGTIAAVSVGYGPGILSMVNAIATAQTERVPLIVINGGPTDADLEAQNNLGVGFVHSTGFGKTDLNVYKSITLGAEEVREQEGAADRIDKLFQIAIEQSGPVYLEIPVNLWGEPIGDYNPSYVGMQSGTTPEVAPLAEMTRSRIASANDPILILGAELQRYDMVDQAVAFIEEQKLPFYTTLLAKTIVSENHPMFAGVYDSNIGPTKINRQVERADFILSMGCIFGVDFRSLITSKNDEMIRVAFGEAQVGEQKYSNIPLRHFLTELNSFSPIRGNKTSHHQKLAGKSYEKRRSDWKERSFKGNSWEDEFGYDAVFYTVDQFLSSTETPYFIGMDTGCATYPAADLALNDAQSYLGNPVWQSIGHSAPATAGAYFATGKKSLIITGDGGFQMVAQIFSTMVRQKIPATIIVLDNGIYAIEQYLDDVTYFTDTSVPVEVYSELNPWKYENLPDVYNGGIGLRVQSISELLQALRTADTYQNEPVLIVAQFSSPRDLPAQVRAAI